MSSSRPATASAVPSVPAVPTVSAVLVLAAGEGTRMRSQTPKVLHAIGGRSLLGHAVAAARSLDPEHLVVVVRHGRDAVVSHLAQIAPDALVADQDEAQGTARAAGCGLAVLPALQGTVVVTYGDVPLLTAQTLARVAATHQESGDAVTVLTSRPSLPGAYGRIVRDGSGATLSVLTASGAQALIASGAATGGMQAKLNSACAALSGGVREVIIAPGAAPGIIQRLLAGSPAGTRLIPDPEAPQ